MRVVVPFAATDPNTRLATILGDDERREFARAMLADVCGAIRGAGEEPELVATAPVDVDVPVTVDERPLTPAVNAIIEGTRDATAVVMADLALATADAACRLFDTPGDVVIAPGRGGGTNALLTRHDEFRVDYHGGSFLDHRSNAVDLGASLSVVDSHRLATDVDERSDLVEVLIHGEGAAVDWLVDAGFELAVRESRLDIRRRE